MQAPIGSLAKAVVLFAVLGAFISAVGRTPLLPTSFRSAAIAAIIGPRYHRIMLSPDRKNSQKLTPLHLHVSHRLNSIRYSFSPFFVPFPPITLRSKANALTACSALLLGGYVLDSGHHNM